MRVKIYFDFYIYTSVNKIIQISTQNTESEQVLSIVIYLF